MLPTPHVSCGRDLSWTVCNLSSFSSDWWVWRRNWANLLPALEPAHEKHFIGQVRKSICLEMRHLQAYFLANRKPCSPNCFLGVLVFCGCCNKVPQNGWLTSSENCREKPFLATSSSWCLPAVLGIPWLTTASLRFLPLSSHGLLPTCRCVAVFSSKDTRHIEFGLT